MVLSDESICGNGRIRKAVLLVMTSGDERDAAPIAATHGRDPAPVAAVGTGERCSVMSCFYITGNPTFPHPSMLQHTQNARAGISLEVQLFGVICTWFSTPGPLQRRRVGLE